jgi:enamine deaminase RidA (YjgF/YER057c/UK114 family)
MRSASALPRDRRADTEPISHFTHIVQAGRLVFVSGCVATDGAGTIVGGADAAAQARQVHENLKRCLAAAGATFADVCKVTVFVKTYDSCR